MTQLGEQCAPLNIPPWRPNTRYQAGFVVINAGSLYTANARATSAATFGADAGNWTTLKIAAPSTALSVVHTGISTFVKIDTTNLWEANGGDVTGGTPLTVDGNAVDTQYGFTQPSASASVVTYLMPVGTHTFELGTHSATLDVYWRGYPERYMEDLAAADNDTYWTGWPIAQVEPGSGNGWADGTPYLDVYAVNNGWSVVPDGNGADTKVHCVAPGDCPLIADTRAETAVDDTYSIGEGSMPGSPTGGVDPCGNLSRTVRFIRLDFLIPSTWTAPLTVENDLNTAWINENIARGYDYQWLPNPNSNGYVASSVVTFDPVTIPTCSNLWENAGPGTFVVGRGYNDGTMACAYQPHSAGSLIPRIERIGSWTPAADTRYSIILEWCPDLFATGNGLPWTVPPGTITAPNDVAWDNSHTVAPYGVPLKSDNVTPNPPYGGGYFRVWMLEAGVWTCTTAGQTYAVPGTPTVSGGVISGGDEGKIFGPTAKCEGGTLNTGPDGSSGTVLLAGTSPPFDITIANLVLGTGFTNSTPGFWCLVGGELMHCYGYTSGTQTLHVDRRAQGGWSAVNHTQGEVMMGNLVNLNLGQGVNQTNPSKPFAVRWWPMLCGPTFASISAAPASNYP